MVISSYPKLELRYQPDGEVHGVLVDWNVTGTDENLQYACKRIYPKFTLIIQP